MPKTIIIINIKIIQKDKGCSAKGNCSKFIPYIPESKVKGKRITEKIVNIFITSLILWVIKDSLVSCNPSINSL